MNEAQQEKNFRHLQVCAETQLQIRRNEIKGIVYTIEDHFKCVYYLGLVSMDQLKALLTMMRSE